MSGADYLHCAVCGAKALYDADVDYDYPNLGALVALCKTCRKTHTLKPVSDVEQAAHDEQVRAGAKADAWDECERARAKWMQDQRYYSEDEMPNPYRTTPAEQKESN